MRAPVLIGLAVLLTASCAAAPTQLSKDEPTIPPASSSMPMEPTSITIPAIDAMGDLIPTGYDVEGALEVPPLSKPEVASYFEPGPNPGEEGASLILGHINGRGRDGIFVRLAELRPGDEIYINMTVGDTLKFFVKEVNRVSKSAFPYEEVFGATSERELRLVTCGGVFDQTAQSYTDNIIVHAAQ